MISGTRKPYILFRKTKEVRELMNTILYLMKKYDTVIEEN